ncbi:MAG: SMC family ATPase [Actinomycetaceae bacterium]|nr:SMC family ATPase [Actinomycetaceae bacterium]
MKLMRLTLQGIGPFLGKHEIDFLRLGQDALFLIKGPTGSGKSTLIDAITYALYGEVAGQKDSSIDRIRSDFASPDDPSRVALVFETSAGIYRVERTPEYLGRSTRSTGKEVKRAKTAALFRLTDSDLEGQGSPVASGIRQVDVEISRLCHLDVNQFLQTVVLPQGKFRTFLESSSSERKNILESLFGTQHFTAIEELAEASARELNKKLHGQQTEAELARKQLLDTFSRPPAGWTFDTSLTEIAEQLEGISVTADSAACLAELSAPLENLAAPLEQALHLASANQDQAKARKDKADLELQKGKEHNKAWQEGVSAQEQLADLESRKEEIQDLQERINKVQGAKRVLAASLGVEANETQITQLRDELDSLYLTQARLFPDGAPPIPSIVFSSIDIVQCEKIAEQSHLYFQELFANSNKRSSQLEALQKLSLRQEQAQSDLRFLEESATTLRLEAQDLDAKLSEFPARQAGVEEKIQRCVQALAKAESYTEKIEAKQKEIADLQAYLASCSALEKTQKELLAATKLTDEAALTVRRLLDVQHKTLALTLAEGLVDGKPCVVCGSTNHPHPASRSQVFDVLSQTALDQEQLTLEQKRAQQADLELKLAKLQGNIESLGKTQGGNSLEDLEVELAALQGHAQDIHRIKLEEEQLKRDAKSLQANLTSLQESYIALTAKTAATDQQITALKRQISQDSAQVSQATLNEGSLEKELLRAQESIDTFQKCSSSFLALKHACGDWLKAQDQLTTAFDDTGISSVQEAQSQDMSPDMVAAGQKTVEEYSKAKTRTEHTLAHPSVIAALKAGVKDLDHLVQECQLCDKTFTTALQVYGGLQTFTEQMLGKRDLLTQILQDWNKAEEDAGPYLKIARIISGHNASRTSLSNFILISRLEDVLASANMFLKSISSARYELRQVSDEAADFSMTGKGLGIEIYDYETDKLRPAKSLSGGESFFTSLALALGLSDVVQTEAGGVNLSDLLIDEGFGTLSDEVLENVMQELENLRKTGKSIGIISHVSALKDLVKNQIIVSPLPGLTSRGSTLEVVC